MNGRDNKPATVLDLRRVQQQVAVQQMQAASSAVVGGEGIEALELAIDGGVDQYPLPTTDQSLAGAISELHAMILANGGGGGGSGNSYFPGGW